MRRFLLPLLAVLIVIVSGIGAYFLSPSRSENSPPELAVLCSNEHAICEAWAESFQKRAHITVLLTRLPTQEALARLRTRRAKPEFDVWIGGPAEAYVQANQEHLLQPYQVSDWEHIPPAFRSSDQTWTGVYASLLGFCSNRKRLQQLGVNLPTSWNDLLQPQLHHQLAASSPLSSGTAYSIMWTQMFLHHNHKSAWKYLENLYQNVNQFTRSGTAPAQAVKRGEAAIALTFAPYCDLSKNSRMVLSYPKEGTGYEIGAMALLKGNLHPNAARKWLDFFSTPFGQESGRVTGIRQLTVNDQSPYSVIKQAKQPVPKLINYDIYQAATAKPKLIKQFAHRYYHYRLGE